MKANRTIRYRLYPATYEKHQKLHGTAGACRYVWNHFVGKLRDEYEYYGESNRRKLAKHRLQKACQAERFARANWYHQTSKLIADKYDIVYMEDLNTQGMTKSAKGTIEPPFVAMATNGVTLWRTLTWVCRSDKLRLVLNSGYSKNHPDRLRLPAPYTSQTCNKCGSVDKANRKTQSIFKCQQCGHEDKADVNAALNILAAGNTATGRGDGGISRSVKRQKNEIAKRANQLVKLNT